MMFNPSINIVIYITMPNAQRVVMIEYYLSCTFGSTTLQIIYIHIQLYYTAWKAVFKMA